jgi:hypothetical protein
VKPFALAALVLGAAALPAQAAPSRRALLARTFAPARRDADAITRALAPSRALPDELKSAAGALLDGGVRHVERGAIRAHGKIATGDKQAWVELEGGRSVKIDSHASGFIELFAHEGARLAQWGELYLFGAHDPQRLGAVAYRRLQPSALRGEATLREVEAYRVPGAAEETWLVFARTSSHDAAAGRPRLFRGEAQEAMRAAGIQMHDTGPQRAITDSPQLARALRRLLRSNDAFQLVTASAAAAQP